MLPQISEKACFVCSKILYWTDITADTDIFCVLSKNLFNIEIHEKSTDAKNNTEDRKRIAIFFIYIKYNTCTFFYQYFILNFYIFYQKKETPFFRERVFPIFYKQLLFFIYECRFYEICKQRMRSCWS